MNQNQNSKIEEQYVDLLEAINTRLAAAKTARDFAAVAAKQVYDETVLPIQEAIDALTKLRDEHNVVASCAYEAALKPHHETIGVIAFERYQAESALMRIREELRLARFSEGGAK